MKCEFQKTELSFLAYRIGQQGVGMEDVKVTAMSEWLQPASVKELQWFLEFYRRFIRSFSAVAAPLTNFLKGKPKQIVFTHEATLTFNKLKHLFVTAPVLKLPRPAKQFIVEVDASEEG